jgi:hypothetical protein
MKKYLHFCILLIKDQQNWATLCFYLGGRTFHFEVYNNRRNQAAIQETKNKTLKE